MKRQIIKTRSVRPYRFARIVIAIVVLALLAAAAYMWWSRAHGGAASHSQAGAWAAVRAAQDFAILPMKSRSPAILV
jgi:hypothetical protein